MNAYARTMQVPVADRDRLIADHIGMAQRIARKVARRTPDWISEDDLIGAAMIGLAESAERFDPQRGEPFVAFAETRIRGAVLDELRRGDLMSRRARASARQIGKTLRRLEHALGRSAEDEEIAAALGVTLDVYRADLEMLTHVSVVDIDPHEATLMDRGDGPAAEAERHELQELLQRGLAQIPERDALVLSLYYIEDCNYAEIGEILKVSESRVCQLHARALTRLRAEVGEIGPS